MNFYDQNSRCLGHTLSWDHSLTEEVALSNEHLLNTQDYELRVYFWRKLMLAVSQHQWDQWEIFLLPSAKSNAENSTVLADSKFISILRQSKQEIQFIEICLETQKNSCIVSPYFYKPIESSKGKGVKFLVSWCSIISLIEVQTSNLAVYPCDCSHNDTSEHGLADMVVMHWWLDLMILEVLSNLNDSMILWF